MRPGLLCLLLLPGCSFLWPSETPDTYGYALNWYCVSPEGCERSEEVMRIDHVTKKGYDFHFTSTQDESFGEDALMILSDSLGFDCEWLYDLSLFGHDLERSRLCFNPGGFQIELSIPNADPATQSRWVVAAQDVDIL